jgi:flagellar M-ring protein FliF
MAEQQNNTTNQTGALSRFEQLSAQQKMGLGAGVAALIALVVGAWIWGQTPDYRVLYSNLSDRDGGAIIDSLQQLNIPYKFAEGGGALMIPANQVHEARLKLAAQGLPKGGTVGFELMENQKFGITQFAEQVNYQRALEGELARSVQTIGAVAAARVHLAIPKPSVFIKEQQKPSASVVLTMHGGRLLDSTQVSAIVHLISSSVPDLAAKNVTVVDQDGTLLSATQGENGTGMDAKQVQYVQQIEQNYIKRIEDILTPLYGANNIRAQVTANIDFARTEQTAEIYKPNQNPADSSIRSQQNVETLNGSGLSASGVPGALSNQPPVPATAPIVSPAAPAPGDPANEAKLDNLHKESTVNYEVDRTISHTVMPVGMVKRLSVAVVVNNHKVTDPKGKVSFKPLSDAEKTQIDNLVKDAVGFDSSRGDSLNVQNAAFNDDKEVAAEVPLWQQPEMIELAKQLAKYLLIAVVMLIVVFKIIKPAFRPLQAFKSDENETGDTGVLATDHEPATHAEGIAGVDVSGNYTPMIAPYEQNLNIARQIAQQDPKIVASVIKEWVNGNE